MSVRIITDSASDMLPPYDSALTVLPITVTFGEESFQDGVTLSHRAFYEKLVEGDHMPVTTQINPSVYEDAFRRAVEAGESVVAIILSSKLSGSYQSACIAAEEFPGKVFVVDSLGATVGEAVLVRRGLELLKEGLDAAAIAKKLEEERADVRLVALVDTLEYLKRGGRLSASAAMIGGMLSIKPVVGVVDGEVVVLGKARGSKNGNNLLVEEINKTGGVDFDRPYQLCWSGLSDELLKKYIEDSRALWEGHVDQLPITTLGCTIGAHVGPGAVAVAFFRKKA